MTTSHLTPQEIDLVILGEEIGHESRTHLESCLTCCRRRDEVMQAIVAARAADPAPALRERLRRVAVQSMPEHRGHTRWWLAAAAALAIIVLSAVFLVPALRPQPVDTDAVLLGVDEGLARDPLAAMADESVVEVVVGGTAAEPAGTS